MAIKSTMNYFQMYKNYIRNNFFLSHYLSVFFYSVKMQKNNNFLKKGFNSLIHDLSNTLIFIALLTHTVSYSNQYISNFQNYFLLHEADF